MDIFAGPGSSVGNVRVAVWQPGVEDRLLSGRVGGLRSSRGGGIKGGDFHLIILLVISLAQFVVNVS